MYGDRDIKEGIWVKAVIYENMNIEYIIGKKVVMLGRLQRQFCVWLNTHVNECYLSCACCMTLSH